MHTLDGKKAFVPTLSAFISRSYPSTGSGRTGNLIACPAEALCEGWVVSTK